MPVSDKIKMRKKKISSPIPPYLVAVACLIYCVSGAPLYKISHFLVLAVILVAVGLVAGRIFKPKLVEVPEAEQEPTPSPEKYYSQEVQKIIEEGRLAQKEMGRLYASIQSPGIRAKINEIMQVSDKIVQDAKHDPSDVPQIQRFLSYYLPTTIKLLNAYDRMSDQGIEGENITTTMSRIEAMLDSAIAAYKKQLDSLFANQALDIETDIQVMNAMLAREGLAEDGMRAAKTAARADAADAGDAAR